MIKSLNLIFVVIFMVTACNETPTDKKVSATSKKTDSAVLQIESINDSAIAKVTNFLNMALVGEATDAIMDIPEIKRLDKYISKKSGGKHKMVVWCFSTGTEGTRKYAHVNVGEDNGLSLVSHYIFSYYADNKSILYYDALTDSTLSLAEWRKTKVTW